MSEGMLIEAAEPALSEDREAPPAPASAAGGRPLVRLVPNSAIQFLDLKLRDVDAARVRRRFLEERGADGAALHAVSLEGDIVHHPVTGASVDATTTYAIDGAQALEPFLDAWVPVPFLREAGTDEDGNAVCEEGPSNWVRAYITRGTPDGARHGGYRVVLAIDTAIAAQNATGLGALAGPRIDDLEGSARFRFSADEGDIASFVSEAWVDDWLAAVFAEHVARQSATHDSDDADADAERGLAHLAHYLTLLSVLAELKELPDLGFLALSPEPQRWDAVGVDLVLDIGASRTTAWVSERPVAAPGERASSRLLSMRDLAQPWRTHSEVFSSRLDFSRPAFGNEAWSRWSGRINAFHWPSLARVGREAERHGAAQSASDDRTGVSSPMHYLWDLQPAGAPWRFSRASLSEARGALLSGLQLAHLTETGELVDPAERRSVALKPRFSRSALMTFFIAEILAQALSDINASRRRGDGRPRLLQRLVLTVAPNLPPHEQTILRRRAETAVQIVWRSMGFSDEGAPFRPRAPEVRLVSDNATNTGLAYVHNELGCKFGGKAREYLDLMGKVRPDFKSGASLRVATLDVGGSATCLSVATYELSEQGALVQTPQIADGCRIGGDDILKLIVERHLIPALERRLIECKLPQARRFLDRIVSGRGGRQRAGGEFGRRFASEIALPLAIGMVEMHMGSRVASEDVPIERTLGDLVAMHAPDAGPVLDELDELSADEGADNFSPQDTLVSFRDRDLIQTIRTVLDPVLSNVARVVQALDCDVVLLSGWPARLPAVLELLVERMPSQPSRIVPMAEYRVGDWYPLGGRSGSVGDPKPLAAAGAAIAVSGTAAGGLTLVAKPMEQGAMRLHVGRISERGMVAADGVMFVLGEAAGKGARTCTLAVEPPVLLGARRMDLETWPATPLFWLDHEPADQRGRVRGPIKVTIECVPAERGQPDTLRVVRACDSDGNTLAPGDVALRLQTLRSPKGHWLDTGAIAIE